MAWFKLLNLAFAFVNAILKHMNDKKLIDAGRALQIKEELIHAQKSVQKAQDARSAALDNFDANDGVPDEQDPNLRD